MLQAMVFYPKVPSTCEICLVKKTPYASQYPGVYVFTTPARMARPVTNLALQQVILLKSGQGQNMSLVVFEWILNCTFLRKFLDVNATDYLLYMATLAINFCCYLPTYDHVIELWPLLSLHTSCYYAFLAYYILKKRSLVLFLFFLHKKPYFYSLVLVLIPSCFMSAGWDDWHIWAGVHGHLYRPERGSRGGE